MKDVASWILERLNTGLGLPSLSPVAVKLVEVASDPMASASDLVSIIEKDPSLATRLLKLANSAFFHTHIPARTLEQAVVRVGFTRLRTMALSISLRDTFPMGKVGPMDYEKFWKISLYRAVMARSLAEHVRSIDPEEAFVSALLMEIGLLVFFELFVKEGNVEVTLELEPLEDLLDWEREEFGLDHREVGRRILEYWKFPDTVISAQDVISAPPQVEATDQWGFSDFQTLLYLARRCSLIIFQDFTALHTIYQEAEELLGLSHPLVSSSIIGTIGLVEDIAQKLNVEFSREKDLMTLMEKANMALCQISEQVQGYGLAPLPSLSSIFKGDDTFEDEKVMRALQAVASEINLPLMAVGGFARKLASSIDPSSQEAKYITVILEEISRLEHVLSEITKKGECLDEQN